MIQGRRNTLLFTNTKCSSRSGSSIWIQSYSMHVTPSPLREILKTHPGRHVATEITSFHHARSLVSDSQVFSFLCLRCFHFLSVF